MNVSFLMAGRARIVYEGQTTLFGALLGKSDTDPVVVQLEDAAKKQRGNAIRDGLSAIELLIAEKVDAGDSLPITNAEGFIAATWLSQGSLASLPDPMPRGFVLYIARAWHKAGKYPTMSAALTDILNTRSFV